MTTQHSATSTSQLWPPISPFKEDFLPVSEIHRIRCALYGNPDGVPVFFLHGGPGCGCSDDDARWFDPKKYLIITHDQRGSGKSTPRAEIKDNTPQDLVEDMEKLRKHLNITGPISIFAGSWGTTLALLYAETYPKNISRMILRGIFTCGWDDQDYFYSPTGAARFSPAAWDKFITRIPKGDDRIQERLHHLIETSDEEGKRKWCTILAEYEYSFFNISPEDFQKEMSNFESIFPEMRINIYYQANRFFLDDQQILKNTKFIKDIPTTIIHGTHDVICPPVSAWKLHKQLSDSTLIFVIGGEHISSDPKIQKALIEAVNNWN